MNKIGILTCAYKRPQISTVFCMMLDRIRTSFPDLFLPVCVTSLKEDKALFESFGVEAYDFPNSPLGAKWNHGLQRLKGRCDGVMFLGSDDLVNDSYIETILSIDADIKWCKGLYIFSLANESFGRLRFIKDTYSNYAGAGRIVSSYVLDKCNWQLWEDNDTKYLDSIAHAKAVQYARGVKSFSLFKSESFLVDIKSAVNMNGMRMYKNLYTLVDTNILFSRLSKKEGDYLRSLMSGNNRTI